MIQYAKKADANWVYTHLEIVNNHQLLFLFGYLLCLLFLFADSSQPEFMSELSIGDRETVAFN